MVAGYRSTTRSTTTSMSLHLGPQNLVIILRKPPSQGYADANSSGPASHTRPLFDSESPRSPSVLDGLLILLRPMGQEL